MGSKNYNKPGAPSFHSSDAPTLRASSAMTRVIIVDSACIQAAQLAASLDREPDLKAVVCGVDSARDFVAQVTDLSPDVLVVRDRFLGADDVGSIHARLPQLRVLLLCREVDLERIGSLIALGVCGYLTELDVSKNLVRAVRGLRRGEFWMPRAQLTELVRQTQRSDSSGNGSQADYDALTPRERQVAQYLRRGCSNKEIARALGIKEDTVKKHLNHVFNKVHIKRRTQLLLSSSVTAPIS